MLETLQVLLVVGVGGICLLAVLAVAFARKGLSRAPLGAFALPLAQLPLLLAVGLASRTISSGFSAVAERGMGAAAVTEILRQCLWLLVVGGAVSVLGAGIFFLTLLPLPFARDDARDSRRPASARRTAFLLSLALMGTVAAGMLFEYTRQSVDIVRIVVLGNSKTAEGRAEAEKYDVLAIKGSQGIAAASSRIARGTVLGMTGAPYLGVVLFGAALVGAIIAWPVRGSRTGAAVWMIACLLFCLIAFGQVARIGLELKRLPARALSAAAPA
jgi:hypothetical protein